MTLHLMSELKLNKSMLSVGISNQTLREVYITANTQAVHFWHSKTGS